MTSVTPAAAIGPPGDISRSAIPPRLLRNAFGVIVPATEAVAFVVTVAPVS